jgi:hypothetical protein
MVRHTFNVNVHCEHDSTWEIQQLHPRIVEVKGGDAPGPMHALHLAYRLLDFPRVERPRMVPIRGRKRCERQRLVRARNRGELSINVEERRDVVFVRYAHMAPEIILFFTAKDLCKGHFLVGVDSSCKMKRYIVSHLSKRRDKE